MKFYIFFSIILWISLPTHCMKKDDPDVSKKETAWVSIIRKDKYTSLGPIHNGDIHSSGQVPLEYRWMGFSGPLESHGFLNISYPDRIANLLRERLDIYEVDNTEIKHIIIQYKKGCKDMVPALEKALIEKIGDFSIISHEKKEKHT